MAGTTSADVALRQHLVFVGQWCRHHHAALRTCWAVLEVVAFFAAPKARCITGEVLVVDGSVSRAEVKGKVYS